MQAVPDPLSMDGRFEAVAISTGDISGQYEIVDVVMALASDGAPGLLAGDGDPNTCFRHVVKLLREQAFSLGGDAVVNCSFEHRVAVTGEGILMKQAIEIFAYGTVVKRNEDKGPPIPPLPIQ